MGWPISYRQWNCVGMIRYTRCCGYFNGLLIADISSPTCFLCAHLFRLCAGCKHTHMHSLEGIVRRQHDIEYSHRDAASSLTCTGWLFVNECSTRSLLWQSITVFGTELQGISPTTVCQSLNLLVASTCDLPDVINCQFHEFAAAPLGPVHFLSPDQESARFSCWPQTI